MAHGPRAAQGGVGVQQGTVGVQGQLVGYLDEEAVADVADLHGLRVHLSDVLLHLQDGPAVQGEVSFLLQGHGWGVGCKLRPPAWQVLSLLQFHSPRGTAAQLASVHVSPCDSLQQGTQAKPRKDIRDPAPHAFEGRAPPAPAASRFQRQACHTGYVAGGDPWSPPHDPSPWGRRWAAAATVTASQEGGS